MTTSRPLPGDGLSRRRFLGGLAGLGAGAYLLSSCSSGGSTPANSTPGAQSGFTLPEYAAPRELAGATISDVPGVLPAYERFPLPPFTSVAQPPGRGGTVTSLHPLFTAPPDDLQGSEVFQAFQRGLGVTLEPTFTPIGSYENKLATVLAGGSIPDITWVNTETVPAAVSYFQQGAFADLSDVLGGDGVGAYPNLAQLPSYAWRNCAVEGVLYGVPRGIPLLNNSVALYRADWAATLGFPEPPADAAEYLELMTAFSKGNPRGSGQSWGAAVLDAGFVRQMFRVPNEWRLEDDGTLTHYIESDEYRAALEFHIEEFGAGVYHPDATMGGDTYTRAIDLLQSGQVGFYSGSLNAQFALRRPGTQSGDPGSDVQPLAPPGHDGGDPLTYEQRGYYGMAAVSAEAAKDDERLHELLGILDYWSAPFGSEEYVLVNYGLEGRQVTFEDSGQLVPVPPDQAPTEALVPYLTQVRETLFYFPGAQADARLAQGAMETVVQSSAPNPTTGLISDTAIRQGAALGQLNNDYETGIVTGQRSLDELEEWRDRWRSGGGDAMRREFRDALERLDS